LLADDGFEDLELFYPYFRLKEAGFDVVVASDAVRTLKGKRGYTYEADLGYESVMASDYDLLIVGGGKAPERIRQDKKALEIVKHFFEEDKVVGSICHGPQVLISADVLKNRKATSYEGVLDDLAMAGAKTCDAEVVVDGNLITSRKPADLSAFMGEIMKKIR